MELIIVIIAIIILAFGLYKFIKDINNLTDEDNIGRVINAWAYAISAVGGLILLLYALNKVIFGAN